MKVKHLFFSVIAAAFLTSAIGSHKTLEVGSKAPKIETIDGANVVADATSEGKVKIVSFWSPKKPASRITNKTLHAKYAAEPENVDLISICLDSDENLMREVMKQDGIEDMECYSVNNIARHSLKDYQADKDPKAYIIGADGRIEKML
ncbi:MAG: hypothetical protein J1F38_07770 [Muribaculaceae bacterium]|nr:hypothetical protein [Muribaculaceae bacterium]